MSQQIVVLLTVVCALTYSFEIVFGLAGTIMMVAIMSLFVAPQVLVIYSLLPQILVALVGLGRTRRRLDVRLLAGMLGFAALGALLGLYLFFRLSPELFRRLFAAAIMVFGLYLVLTPKGLRLHPGVGRGLDVLAGVSQGLFGVSGPIAMTRLLGTVEHKTDVRNHALAFFLCLNLVRAGGYVVQRTITADIAMAMVWSAPVLLAVLWFANHLHVHVNEVWFRRVVAWAILLGGVSMWWH
jgi:uncharacterized membrane protein YfcA